MTHKCAAILQMSLCKILPKGLSKRLWHFRKMSGFSQIVNVDGHLLHTMTVNIVDFLRVVEVSLYKLIIIVAHFLVWGSEKIL